MTNTMNIQGTEAGLITEALPETRSMVRALRDEHGADSPIGHICSNILEATENYAKSDDPDQRGNLLCAMLKWKNDLNRLLSQAQ